MVGTRCTPSRARDDESGLFLAGSARQVTDPILRAALSEQFVAERSRFDVPAPDPDHLLFELGVDRCLLTTSTGHDDPAPHKQTWRAEAATRPDPAST